MDLGCAMALAAGMDPHTGLSMEGKMAITAEKTPPGYKGQAHVEVENPDKSVQQKSHDIGDTPKPAKQLPVVGVNLGTTINTGNYNSVRVGVSISIPCEPDEIEAVYAFAQEWVDEKVTRLAKAAREAYGL